MVLTDKAWKLVFQNWAWHTSIVRTNVENFKKFWGGHHGGFGLGAMVVGTIFCWGYILYAHKGFPRLWNTFGPASITLDTKSTVEINYEVSETSAAKLKKHKVRNWLI